MGSGCLSKAGEHIVEDGVVGAALSDLSLGGRGEERRWRNRRGEQRS